MFFIIGAVIVVGCVFGGYLLSGGHIEVLIQPFEVLIIGGAAIGAYIISNPKPVLTRSLGAIGALLKGSPYTKDSYIELLSMMYTVFRLAKSKGMLALESHVENAEESDLFNQFPTFHKNHHALDFFCDYLRLMTMGSENPHEIETLIDEELEIHHKEMLQVSDAIQTVADGLPALGIVAAVLGVIHTMGAITEPPEILGGLIGGALVGTFLGVLLAYGFVGPIAKSLENTYEAEARYYQCIKAGLLAYLQGYAPAIAVEFARKALLSPVRPTFYEVENAVNELPPVKA
jgi:chemotaxis protein MotA